MAAFSTRVRTYYYLTKPGIIYGNALTTIAGFLLASARHIDVFLFIRTLLASSLVIGSACVINNYLDRAIDAKMARTSKRALVTQAISVKNALVFATVLGVVGFVILAAFVNPLTFWVGLVGFLDYVIFYGIAKRKSVHGTLVGTISGSTPIVAGYTAVADHLGWIAPILFLIMVAWQMAHFYAIAIYRLKDYKAAGLPVRPVKTSAAATKPHILGYTLTFTILCVVLKFSDHLGYIYLILILITSLIWLKKALDGFKAHDNSAWGKQMFLFSLIVILVFSATLSLNAWLPWH